MQLSTNQASLIYMIIAVVFTVLLYIQPIAAAAILLMLFMSYVTWRKPILIMTLIFIAAPFQQDLSGKSGQSGGGALVAFSAAELFFAASLPFFLAYSLARRRPLYRSPFLPAVVLYLLSGVLSSIGNWYGQNGLVCLLQMSLYLVLVVMAFASFVEKTQDLLITFKAAVGVGILFSALILLGLTAALGFTKNGIGSALGAFLVICVELWFAETNMRRKRWLMAALAMIAMALLLSLSRGAWLGAIGGLIVISVLRREFRSMLRIGIVLAILVPICWYLLPQEKRDYAIDFNPQSVNVDARYRAIEYAHIFFEQNPLIGSGIGLRKEVDATNVFWFTLAETGIIGLTFFTLIHYLFYRMIWQTQKRVSRSDPLFSLVVLGAALVTGKLLHGMVDHYWSRGEIMMTWAAAGMATRVYYLALAKERKQKLASVVFWQLRAGLHRAGHGPLPSALGAQNRAQG